MSYLKIIKFSESKDKDIDFKSFKFTLVNSTSKIYNSGSQPGGMPT